MYRYLLATALACGAAPALAATTYGGITFEAGDVAFADAVVDFAVGDGVTGDYTDPQGVLGAPDFANFNGIFSLGRPGATPDLLADGLLGFVTVQFIDNSLTTSGDDAPDLFVYEDGPAIEVYDVEISTNNIDWIFVRRVSGQPSAIDIDAVAGVSAGDLFSYVRVTDAPGGPASSAPFAGPDIDAIGAISSAPPIPPVPLPAAGWAMLMGLGALMGMRRRRA